MTIVLCSEVKLLPLIDEHFGEPKTNLAEGDLVWDGKNGRGHVMRSATECECGEVDVTDENIVVLARPSNPYRWN